MKRYLVFAASIYYPSGGWNDFVGSADTMESAGNMLLAHCTKDKFTYYYTAHIVDSAIGNIVFDYNGEESEENQESLETRIKTLQRAI